MTDPRALLGAALADPQRIAEIPLEALPAVLLEAERQRGALAGLVRLLAARLPGGPAPSRGRRDEPLTRANGLLTLKEAADLAKVTPKFLRRRLTTLPGVQRIGPRTIRVEQAAFLRWLHAQRP